MNKSVVDKQRCSSPLLPPCQLSWHSVVSTQISPYTSSAFFRNPQLNKKLNTHNHPIISVRTFVVVSCFVYSIDRPNECMANKKNLLEIVLNAEKKPEIHNVCVYVCMCFHIQCCWLVLKTEPTNNSQAVLTANQPSSQPTSSTSSECWL